MGTIARINISWQCKEFLPNREVSHRFVNPLACSPRDDGSYFYLLWFLNNQNGGLESNWIGAFKWYASRTIR